MMLDVRMLGLIILATSFLNLATAKVHYITPNSSDRCTTQCLTISEIATNTSHYISSNTTLIFTAGTHYLTENLAVSDLNNVVITSKDPNAQIVCMDYIHILFSLSKSIHVSNLKLVGCSARGIIVLNAEDFVLQNVVFDGQDVTVTPLSLTRSTAKVINCSFIYNNIMKEEAMESINGLVVVNDSNTSFSQCQFKNNRAIARNVQTISVMFMINSSVIIDKSTFINNMEARPTHVQYVIRQERGHVSINNSYFYNNSASDGGAISSFRGSLNVTNSTFCGNRGTLGGVLYLSQSAYVFIRNSSFTNNTATKGGVLYSLADYEIIIDTCSFHSNIASNKGGVLFAWGGNIIINAKDSNFTNNTAKKGAVIYALIGILLTMQSSVVIANNMASKYATIYMQESQVKIIGHFVFANNIGSFELFNTNVSFWGNATFLNNHINSNASKFQKGGAITTFLSTINIHGICTLSYNYAENGGALHSSLSKVTLYQNGNLTITHNSAHVSGGGIYLYNSEMNCKETSEFLFLNNFAASSGGGVHAIGSSIILSGDSDFVNNVEFTPTGMYFRNNTAVKGGGLSLESNSKLYFMLKTYAGFGSQLIRIHYVGNSADYGAAMFVDDDTYTGTCSMKQITECFFQTVSYDCSNSSNMHKIIRIHYVKNYANRSGSTLYGGLLDRCAINPYTKVDHSDTQTTLKYFMSLSNFTNVSISSGPVKVCCCVGNGQRHDCNCKNTSIIIRRGGVFTVSVVAVDQVRRPVNATIQSSLTYSESGLAEGQLLREIQDKCTDLSFSITSTHNYENLSLYASDGPCKDADLSKLTYHIQFLPCECPVGFQLSKNSQSNCTCDCHKNISCYVICDIHKQSFVRKYKSNVWISYDNSSGYLVYPNCPYDYCKAFTDNSTSVNLNQPNGADAQCAFNRSSLLCGSCEPGLSLSLGSSLCLSCPIHWPALLTSITIAAILAGIALVTLLLTLNMTVAVGTLNGLLLYVNILSANRSILFPFQEQNYITMLISWLNLELGIDTCYFDGMDTYTKTWIELVFPFYIMFIVALVIIISSYSTKFSKVIGRKDPVATLATLILFSYATLLQVIFRVFSSGTLTYADGTTKVIWLPDATIGYLNNGKHIALFLVALLILVIGLVYTVLVFSWQWLLRLPDWKIFMWSRNSRLQTFIETYHTPYTARHRYWTGLLLLVRVALYFTAAVNVSNCPRIALTSISITIGFLLFLKGFVGRVYKKWPLELLESFFYFNILFLSSVTWYSLGDSENNREAAAHISVLSTLIVLFIIILFHVYFHTSLFTNLRGKIPMTGINRFFSSHPPSSPNSQSPPPDEDIHRFHELLDIIDRPANTNDYEQTRKQQSAKPTCSVVEIRQPLLKHQD